MRRPTLEEFRKLSRPGVLVPVMEEILVDEETPVSAYRKTARGDASFLLESIEGGEKWGRYSILGTEPEARFVARGDRVEITRREGTERIEGRPPMEVLGEILAGRRTVPVPGLPRFSGGAVGYFGYEVARSFERLPARAKDVLGLPDIVLLVADSVLIFDNLLHTVKVIANAAHDADPAKAYGKAVDRIEELKGRLRAEPAKRGDGGPRTVPEFRSSMGRDAFLAKVERIREYIRAGDAVQVVLAHALSVETPIDPFDAYRALRVINPSPYMYHLRLGPSLTISGASPEVLVRKEGRNVLVRPIAGTMARGATEEEDQEIIRRLRADEKERAEHVMLVDLGRNDLGRISEYGSVVADEIMSIERYSHVIHLVSNVRGRLREGLGPLEVLRACFPAGTVSGAPKIRAMEIIDEMEEVRRGPYAGAVGYIDFHGNLDTAIALRSIVFDGGRAHVGVGAGIVADSVPEREWDETMEKGAAMIEAMRLAGRGLAWE
jgi:anthranilate synthase component 1